MANIVVIPTPKMDPDNATKPFLEKPLIRTIIIVVHKTTTPKAPSIGECPFK